jgi:hypothetical protein
MDKRLRLYNSNLKTRCFPWKKTKEKTSGKFLLHRDINIRTHTLVGRYPPRLEQKAEYFFPLVFVQSDGMEGARDLAPPLQGVVSQQTRLQDQG